MWWMEGNNNNNNNKLHLRPLMPRQPIADRMLPWNHHHHHHPMAAAAGEYGLKREVGPHTLVSTRWNPTPEQLQGLEELYRRGTRTPSAEQIQHIASRLRRFGKIEGKNVFYWFQNHKARERQKKRRQLIQHHQPPPPAPPGILSKRSYLDHKKLATNTPPQEEEEESASMHGSVIAERNKKLDVWTHTNTNCVQQQQQQDADHEIITSWKLDLSLFDKPATPPPPPPGQQNADPTTEIKLNRTLQLFPIRTTVDSNGLANRDDNVSGNESDLLHNQFIEFLPTKKYNCG